MPLNNFKLGNFVFIEIPAAALEYGFVNNPVGTHGSRTIILEELRLLLKACPGDADYEQYKHAIIDDNVLFKRTLTTRKESVRRLRELYALDHKVLLFRALRDLWEANVDAQPMLALLCAVARDSILRGTVDLILAMQLGETVTPQMIEKATEESFPGRYNPMTLANVGRHAASSWAQSGHLAGRLHKTRAQAICTETAATYALFLGYLCGVRGDALFHTVWARLLDASVHQLHACAQLASQRGWLDYRHSGAVTDISFQYLFRA